MEEMSKLEEEAQQLQTECLEHCPECELIGIRDSAVRRIRIEDGRYVVTCTRKGCWFLEEFRGISLTPVTTEDLILFGIPGELLQHLEMSYGDIDKIIRLSMSEYIKTNYLTTTLDFDVDYNKEYMNIAKYHNLGHLVGPLQKTGNSTKSHEQDLTQDQGLAGSSTGSTPACDQLSQSTATDNLVSQNLNEFSQPLEPVKFHTNKFLRRMTKTAAMLVEDLTMDYQEKIKSAFSKLEGYNFPEDLVNSFGSDDLPLFAEIEERKRQRRIEAEVQKQLEDFDAKRGGFDFLN